MSNTSRFKKIHLLIYSLGIAFVTIFVTFFVLLWIGQSSSLSSDSPLTKMFSPELRTTWIVFTIQTTLFVFLYWLFVRWVASTAEKAGRSYLAFMFLAIFIPVVAWIVVIMFKKPDSAPQPVITE